MTWANACLFIGATLLTTCLLVPKRNAPPCQEDKIDYEFIPRVNRECALGLAGKNYAGRLDAAGNFVWEPTWSAGISGPELLNMADDKPVYEYRSGYLIKGIINEHLKFVPELGSKVISFKDYRYSKNAIRIYNLPGEFVDKNLPPECRP